MLYSCFGAPVVARRFLWNTVCLSFYPSFYLLGHFRGILSLIFSKFWHGAKNPYKVVHDKAGFSGGKISAIKFGKIGQKQGFLNLLKNLVINFYWVYLMKVYIICCVPAQIPYLGKFLFLRCGPKCSQPIRLQHFLVNHIFRTIPWNSVFFACWYKFP